MIQEMTEKVINNLLRLRKYPIDSYEYYNTGLILINYGYEQTMKFLEIESKNN